MRNAIAASIVLLAGATAAFADDAPRRDTRRPVLEMWRRARAWAAGDRPVPGPRMRLRQGGRGPMARPGAPGRMMPPGRFGGGGRMPMMGRGRFGAQRRMPMMGRGRSGGAGRMPMMGRGRFGGLGRGAMMGRGRFDGFGRHGMMGRGGRGGAACPRAVSPRGDGAGPRRQMHRRGAPEAGGGAMRPRRMGPPDRPADGDRTRGDRPVRAGRGRPEGAAPRRPDAPRRSPEAAARDAAGDRAFQQKVLQTLESLDKRLDALEAQLKDRPRRGAPSVDRRMDLGPRFGPRR